MKTLRRTVIIRDSDLSKLMYKVVKTKLYDRFDVEPMTYKGIEQENIISAIKGESISQQRNLPNLYEEMLWREKSLYNRQYLEWTLTMDYPNGQIYVRSRSVHPREALYRVTFERDYE